jgi:SAM-dependent methyltransferase
MADRPDPAAGFGSDAQRYDRARPRYPDALVERVLRGLPGRLVLDVGTGTGIVARQFQAAGCQVLGIDADPRMAEFARGTGVDVEVATFEAWQPAGRTYDAVVSGQSWHWVDATTGAMKAAEVLRPGGRIAVFWNTGQPPPGLAEAFAEVYRRVLPPSFAERLTPEAVAAGYDALCARAVEAIRSTGAFEEPERWRFEWTQSYTRDEWLDALQTSGGAIPPADLGELLTGVGDAIDAAGGTFPLSYETIVVTARRTPPVTGAL